ncbi:MAG: deoxyribodipyrimidine photo-lyase [Pseudomonadota bacterium]
MANPPTLLWLRRDLRLADHPALQAACADGGPVIPVFILDPETEAIGAAPRWRLERSVLSLAADLERIGSRLILRRGEALEVLQALIAETGAKTVRWTRLYDPVSKARDELVKSTLKGAGIAAVSHPGHVLFEPWTVTSKTGGFYKVYTPYWKCVAGAELDAPLPAPSQMPAPEHWPESLAELGMGRDMRRGADIVARYAVVGETAARNRLGTFLETAVADYASARDRTDRPGTSGLSENLTYGEISARTVWHAGHRAMVEGAAGAETFIKELVWRDFAWHLIHHTPHLTQKSWRPEWEDFPWEEGGEPAELWKRGMTGEPMVDAGMRQMYVTGTMHNRVRMLVASYLTKHLMTHWKVGMDWFAECLIDWDPASNAMGWQWAAGSGPDAAPYFRVFNPATQAEKFDPRGAYRHRWVAGVGIGETSPEANSYFQAIPESWGLSATDPYPERIIDLKAGRERALAAYAQHRDAA